MAQLRRRTRVPAVLVGQLQWEEHASLFGSCDVCFAAWEHVSLLQLEASELSFPIIEGSELPCFVLLVVGVRCGHVGQGPVLIASASLPAKCRT